MLKSIQIATNSQELQIQIPDSTYINRGRLCVVIAQSIPEGITANQVVAITIQGHSNVHYVLDQYGNFVYATQLRSRRILRLTAATDTGVFVAHNCLYPSNHDYGTLPPSVSVPPATITLQSAVTLKSADKGGAQK